MRRSFDRRGRNSGRVEGMDAWIDTYHAVRALTRQDVAAFLTDSAVGTQEENNLRHLVTNLGRDMPRDRVVPFLTTKHSLDFCLSYAEQAWQHGFPALVVLGGDRSRGRPRCVEHAWQLRREIKPREPRLTLGGWANPYGDPVRAAELSRRRPVHRRVLPHPDREPPQRRACRAIRRGRAAGEGWTGCRACSACSTIAARTPGRSKVLSRFLPVPAESLAAEFAAGATPVDICARTLRAMMDVGGAALLHQQSAAAARLVHAQRHPRTRRRPRVRWSG